MTNRTAPDSAALPPLKSVTLTLLGTGTSTGVPVIGCGCRVCQSTDPRDQRTRCAAHVVAHTDAGPVHLQIDTGPDFREQALRHGVRHIDAVLYSHAHFDHVVGADDLRPFLFFTPAPIPCYASPETAAPLRRMLSYIFEDGSYPGVARLDLREMEIEDGGQPGPFVVTTRRSSTDPPAAVEVTPLLGFHGALPVTGFRIGRVAYLTDVSRLPDTTMKRLHGVEVLVLDALRHRPHRTHFTFEEAIEVARQVGAKETAFIHMTHSVLHAEEDAALPEGIRLGYDGMRLETARKR